MSAKSLTVEDAQSANLVLVGPEKGRQAVHDLVTAYRANRRSGSANTKTRGEVSGNNKKIYKQKGTGRPQLAHAALGIDPSIAAVLPCNVVVRSLDEGTTLVEAFDPDAMTRLAGDALCDVAADARRRLDAVLDALGGER